MANKTLKTLAKDYANGIINKDAYRKARDELFKGILSGKIAVVKNEYRKPLEFEELDITRDKTAIMPAADTPAKKPRPTTEIVSPDPPPRQQSPSSLSSLRLILVTSVIATICVIVIVVLYAKTGGQEQETHTDMTTAPQENNPVVQTSDAGQILIDNFLKQNNWSDDSLQQFISEWRSLSSNEQAAALSSPIKARLTNAISRQLLEERALYSLGGDRASIITRQQSLVNFADEMGIKDPRISVQKFDESMVDTTAEEESAATDTIPAILPESDSEDIALTANPQENPAESMVTEESVTESTDIENIDTPTTEKSSIQENPATDVTTSVQETVAAETSGSSAKSESISGISEKTIADAGSSTSTATTTTNKHACRTSLAKQRQPYCRDIIDGIGKAPTMVVVPGGKFMMGGEKPQELPRHEVVIPKPFAVAVNEITRGEYEQFCNDIQRSCPQQPWSDKEYPVVNVTWNDAVAYTNWLSDKTGNQYRLPTEAEWEYAARARTKTKYPFGDEILLTDAVFSSIKTLTSPLPRSDRSINRNKFRLYHMAGNVREWVLDTWADNYNNAPANGSTYTNSTSDSRVVRGGSYADNEDALRSGARISLPADNADVYTGFRIVQELSE